MTTLRKTTQRRHLFIGGVCLDHFHSTAAIQLGGKCRLDHRLSTVGGGVANVASGVKKLAPDDEVLVLAATGDDAEGDEVRRQLHERGVSLAWGTVAGARTSRSTIVTECTGRSTILSEPGARTLPVPLGRIEELLPGCASCWVVAPQCNEQLRPIVELASRYQVPVHLGVGGAQVERGYSWLAEQLSGPVALLICNHDEARRLTGREKIEEQLTLLKMRGRVRTVVITAGGAGIHALHEGEYCEVKAFSDGRPVVDETGAGDAAQSVIGWWLLKGEPLEDALLVGARQGFEAITSLGAATALLGEPTLRSYLWQQSDGLAA